MTKLLDKAVAAARSLSPDMQDDIARVIFSLTGHDQPLFDPPIEEEARVETNATAGASMTSVQRLQDPARMASLQAVDRSLARGLADANAGRVTPLDEAFRRLRSELGLL